jgi:hypothetical protein
MERIERDGRPYLDRWHIAHFKCGQRLYLHYFHRGDAEDYNHDHPWSFWSLILWGGYYEVTPFPDGSDERQTWYYPLSLLKRPATWKHRVKLPEGRVAITLVWTGRKERSWGFWCPERGFVHWRQHELQGGCEEPPVRTIGFVYYPSTRRAVGQLPMAPRVGEIINAEPGAPTFRVVAVQFPNDECWTADLVPRESK